MPLRHKNIGWPANTPSILHNAKLMASPSSEGFFINTSDQVREVLDRITSIAPQEQAALFIDLEGRTLGRDGTISILQIFAEPLNEVYLLDINALQTAAFITGSKNDISLKSILENDKITKAVFDVRNDSDALHFHYGIKLQGVVDVQLMHTVLTHQNQQLRGLGHCVDQFAAAYSQGPGPKGAHKYQPIDKNLFTASEATALAKIKKRGQEMFRADAIIGASFDERPIMKDLLLYSIHDVVMMPKLYRDYMKVLTRNQLANVLKASQHRVQLSLRKDFQPDGSGKKWSPWATKNEDQIKIFWDFSEEECLAERRKTTWGKKQVKDRHEYELKHRVSTGDTPEHWGDERVQIESGSDWTPVEIPRWADPAEMRDDPESPSPKPRTLARITASLDWPLPNGSPVPVFTLNDLAERFGNQSLVDQAIPAAAPISYPSTYLRSDSTLSPLAESFVPYVQRLQNSSFDQSALAPPQPPPPTRTPQPPSSPTVATIIERPPAFSEIAHAFAEEANAAPTPIFLAASVHVRPLQPMSQDNTGLQVRRGALGQHALWDPLQFLPENSSSEFGLQVHAGQLEPHTSYSGVSATTYNGFAPPAAARPQISAAVSSGPEWRRTMRPLGNEENIPYSKAHFK